MIVAELLEEQSGPIEEADAERLRTSVVCVVSVFFNKHPESEVVTTTQDRAGRGFLVVVLIVPGVIGQNAGTEVESTSETKTVRFVTVSPVGVEQNAKTVPVSGSLAEQSGTVLVITGQVDQYPNAARHVSAIGWNVCCDAY